MAVEKELQEIRESVGLYINKDMYNIDKLAETLYIKQSVREKHKKVRIIFNPVYNIDRSHKFEL